MRIARRDFHNSAIAANGLHIDSETFLKVITACPHSLLSRLVCFSSSPALGFLARAAVNSNYIFQSRSGSEFRKLREIQHGCLGAVLAVMDLPSAYFSTSDGICDGFAHREIGRLRDNQGCRWIRISERRRFE
jgi:hypothetical protein